jgi:hypothetical protein
MAVTARLLGQSAPSGTTLTDLYTVASSKQATVSTIAVCNRSSTPTSYRLSHAASAAADALAQYFAYDTPIKGNDTHYITIGATLAATDKIREYATDATLSFSVWGAEEDV